MYSYNPYYEKYLAHHGVLGMHWGIRRYQPYTHGQKGIFKGLKKQRRGEIKSLKKDLRAYKKAGDELAIDATKKAIKDTKKRYKDIRKEYEKEFDAENLETYKNKIATEGTLEEVSRWKNKLSADQLAVATQRLQSQEAFNNYEKNRGMQKLQNAADKINTIANIGKAGINLMDQINTIHNMYSPDSNARKLSSEATAKAALDRLKLAADIPVTELLNKNEFNKKQLNALKDYQNKKFNADYGEKIGKAKEAEERARTQAQKTMQESYKANTERTKDYKNSFWNETNVSDELIKRKSAAKEAQSKVDSLQKKYDDLVRDNKNKIDSLKEERSKLGVSSFDAQEKESKKLAEYANRQKVEETFKKALASPITGSGSAYGIRTMPVIKRESKIFDFSSVDTSYSTNVGSTKVSDLQKAYEAAYERSKSSGKSEAMSKANANRAIYAMGRYSLKQLGDVYVTKDLQKEINKKYNY